MERISIAGVFARRWAIVVVLTVVVFGASLLAQDRKAPSYFGSLTMTVQAHRTYPQTDQLILQGSESQELFTAIATTQNWIADPYYVSKALQGASVSTEGQSLKALSKVFMPVSAVPQASTFQVQYTGASQNEVENVFQSLRAVIDDAKNSYNEKESGLDIIISYTDATVTNQSSGIPLTPIAGLVVGLVFALAVAAVYDRSVRA